MQTTLTMNTSKHRKYGGTVNFKEIENTHSGLEGAVRERAKKMEIFNKGMWFCSYKQKKT